MSIVEQARRFCLVGGLGFLIDASILQLISSFLGINPFLGRVISYITAATTTWRLNRTFTFGKDAQTMSHREWIQYVVLNAIGGGVNYLVYGVVISIRDPYQGYLIIGVAAGSIVGLVCNFSVNKWLVFRV